MMILSIILSSLSRRHQRLINPSEPSAKPFLVDARGTGIHLVLSVETGMGLSIV